MQDLFANLNASVIKTHAIARDHVIEKDKIDENLNCAICSELVLEPKECEECQHLFCTNCIRDWLKKMPICPFKCPKQPMALKEPHRFVKNMIDSLKVQCPNSNRGCDQVLPYNQFGIHLKQCNFSTYQCTNHGCATEYALKDAKMHESECEFRRVQCEKCKAQFLWKEKEQHDCISQLMEIMRHQQEQIYQLKELIIQSKMESNEEIEKLKKIIHLREAQLEQSKYLCSKKHPLSWTQGSMDVKCSKCGSISVTRYSCTLCNTKYCQNCMPPIFILGRCPVQHVLVLQNKPSKSIICDFCAQNPAALGLTNWNDKYCDFDICEKCYKMKQN